MKHPFLHQINESLFIECLLAEDQRTELLLFLSTKTQEASSLLAQISVVAPRCQATPQQLREAINLLTHTRLTSKEVQTKAEPNKKGRANKKDRVKKKAWSAAEELIAELLLHPNIPEEILINYANGGMFLSSLGHRGGPLTLLEILAERYAYPEAITTIALGYYGAPYVKSKKFREFIEKHKEVEMLEYNLTRAPHLSREKRAIVQEVFCLRTSGKG